MEEILDKDNFINAAKNITDKQKKEHFLDNHYLLVILGALFIFVSILGGVLITGQFSVNKNETVIYDEIQQKDVAVEEENIKTDIGLPFGGFKKDTSELSAEQSRLINIVLISVTGFGIAFIICGTFKFIISFMITAPDETYKQKGITYIFLGFIMILFKSVIVFAL